YLDGDLLAAAHDQQVDVVEGVLDRVPLDRLGQREHLRTVGDLDLEELVRAAVADRRRELPGGQRDVLGLLAVAVQHGGHLAGPTGTPGTTLAELGAGFGADTDLGHGKTPSVKLSCTTRVGYGAQGERGSGGRRGAGPGAPRRSRRLRRPRTAHPAPAPPPPHHL